MLRKYKERELKTGRLALCECDIPDMQQVNELNI